MPLAEWTWCHCSVLWLGEGDDQLWRGGRGAIAGCRCSVLWWGGGVTTNFGGVDVVPLITQKLVFAIWGLCWYNLFFLFFCFREKRKKKKSSRFFRLLATYHCPTNKVRSWGGSQPIAIVFLCRIEP